MKKLGAFFLCAVVLSLSCRKATEDTIDCVVELLFASISHTSNPNDAKEITLMVNYAGGYNISVEWEFGDGTSETKVGTTATHRYVTSGTYEVKANMTLSGENHTSCSTSKSKTIDVN